MLFYGDIFGKTEANQALNCKSSRGVAMRRVMNQQMELGEVRIESLDPEPKSRDDIPAVLRGLQHLYVDDETRARLFSLLEAEAVPGVDQTVGRPGMDLWRILVMAILKQGLGIWSSRVVIVYQKSLASDCAVSVILSW